MTSNVCASVCESRAGPPIAPGGLLGLGGPVSTTFATIATAPWRGGPPARRTGSMHGGTPRPDSRVVGDGVTPARANARCSTCPPPAAFGRHPLEPVVDTLAPTAARQWANSDHSPDPSPRRSTPISVTRRRDARSRPGGRRVPASGWGRIPSGSVPQGALDQAEVRRLSVLRWRRCSCYRCDGPSGRAATGRTGYAHGPVHRATLLSEPPSRRPPHGPTCRRDPLLAQAHLLHALGGRLGSASTMRYSAHMKYGMRSAIHWVNSTRSGAAPSVPHHHDLVSAPAPPSACTAMAAHSRTPGCAPICRSTSIDETFSPRADVILHRP